MEDFSKFISPPVLKGEWDLVLDEIFYGCYGFQLFNEEICDRIINAAEEIPSASSMWETQRVFVLFDFEVLVELFFIFVFLDLMVICQNH